jgi:hypothetical protein
LPPPQFDLLRWNAFGSHWSDAAVAAAARGHEKQAQGEGGCDRSQSI